MISLPVLSPHQLKIEKDDLQTIVISIVSLLVVWFLFLGWTPARSIASGDVHFWLLPWLREFAFHAGDWEQIAYRPDAAGGIKIIDVMGYMPVYRLGGLLGLSELGLLNLMALSVQFCFSFLGIRAALDLGYSWGLIEGTDSTLSRVAAKAGLGLLVGFAPIIGWRFAAGHLDLIAGNLLFMAMLAVAAAFRSRRASLTLLAVIAIALSSCFANHGHQTKLYSVVFGAPILIGLLWPTVFPFKNIKAWYAASSWWLVSSALVFVSVFLMLLPVFIGMLAHTLSYDAPRNLGDSVIFSYTTSTIRDWWSSLLWGTELFISQREFRLLGEIHYPIGALIVLLAIVPWRKNLALAIGLAVSGVGAMLFAMDTLVSDVLLASVPPLNSFRVPARAIFPFVLFLPIIAGAALLALPRVVSGDSPGFLEAKAEAEGNSFTGYLVWPGALALGLACFFLPPVWRELLVWIVALLVCVQIYRGRQWTSAPAVLMVFALASVGAFKEKLDPPLDEHAFLDLPRQVEAIIKQQMPPLESSLVRAKLRFTLPVYWISTAVALDISTLAAYAQPTTRYLQLYTTLEGLPFTATTVYLSFQEDGVAFSVFRQIYNVCCAVSKTDTGFEVTDLGPTSGEAWFSKDILMVPSVSALALEMKKAGETLATRVKQTLWLDASDPGIAGRDIFSAAGSNCDTARVEEVNAPRHSQVIYVSVSSPDNCPLTVAMSFIDQMRAYTLIDNQMVELDMFPAFGALTGVMVPKGEHQIVIDAGARTPGWAFLSRWIGFACLIFAFVFSYLQLSNANKKSA